MSELMPCPCGKTPERLVVIGRDYAPQLAYASGDCCGDWSVEVRNHYAEIGSAECDRRAREAWNAAQRAKNQETQL